jgi:hypothetical protein
MRKLHGFASLFVPIFFLGLMWPQGQPRFGWKKTGEETFSLDAMEVKYMRLPSGRLRFEFQAEGAVTCEGKYTRSSRAYSTVFLVEGFCFVPSLHIF